MSGIRKLENGHFKGETLSRHLRNIPKSYFENIISNLTHVSWMQANKSSCLIHGLYTFLYLIIIIFVVTGISAFLPHLKGRNSK